MRAGEHRKMLQGKLKEIVYSLEIKRKADTFGIFFHKETTGCKLNTPKGGNNLQNCATP